MKKAIAAILSTILAGALMIYSGIRSLHFISETLPPDKQILAYFALAATEGGLVLWLLYYLHGASGAWQRGTSLLMVGVDLVGAVALFTADTMLVSGEQGLVATLNPEDMRTVILAMSGIIALNIAATVFCHLTHPDTMKDQAAEEANDKIVSEALKMINANSHSLAAELAPKIAADWMQETRARFTSALGQGMLLSMPPTIDATARDVQPTTQPVSAAPAPARKPFGWFGWRKRAKPAQPVQTYAASAPAVSGYEFACDACGGVTRSTNPNPNGQACAYCGRELGKPTQPDPTIR